MSRYKQKGYFYILNNISEHITLVQLRDSLGKFNHDVSVVVYWIFDSNYEKALVQNRESLDIICSWSVGEEQSLSLKRYFML